MLGLLKLHSAPQRPDNARYASVYSRNRTLHLPTETRRQPTRKQWSFDNSYSFEKSSLDRPKTSTYNPVGTRKRLFFVFGG